MKRILITGMNSYIGTSFERWCLQYADKYSIDTLDMKGDLWKKTSFVGYDTVLHVAGIAHVSTRSNMKDIYYKVNRDLAIETAEKAKMDGVKQFVFMSSIIVYGDCSTGIINRDTVPKPNNFYGESKLQAEEGIKYLQNDMFNVVIIRPPMVYGRGCKGNYRKLSKLARWTPVFPDIDNKRSMIHIDNLCEFLRLVIESRAGGVFFPQNSEHVKTSEMIRIIAEIHGKEILLVRIFNPIIMAMAKYANILNKVFGNLAYEQIMSSSNMDYQVRSVAESVKLTERDYV